MLCLLAVGPTKERQRWAPVCLEPFLFQSCAISLVLSVSESSPCEYDSELSDRMAIEKSCVSSALGGWLIAV